ncbi:MAG: hypothetical protein AB1503_06215 [Bacillota bacterium]|nr:hypothetical protein [Bacillota bacterium]
MIGRALVRAVAAFLLGVCAGAWLAVPFFASRLREVTLELEAARQELEEEKARAQSLARAEPEQLVVKEVDCLVLCSDLEARLVITRQASELTRHLVGRPVRQLDPFLLHNLLHGRRVVAGEREYVLLVDAVLASEKVAYYLRASPLER